MATINLYPPMVDTYMPAFLIPSNTENSSQETNSETTCKVYFSLSLYNTKDDIENVQVIVTDQNTNVSVLDSTKYPTGIMLTGLNIDPMRASSDRYYINIRPDDIEGGSFKINKYYKVQLRFTSKDASKINSNQAIDSWLTENLSYFSEWSTICLVRGISMPHLNLIGLDEHAEEIILTSTLIDIVGKVTFQDPAETDYIKHYQIQIYDNKQQLIVDSGIIYTDNYVSINEINYAIKKALKDGEFYTLNVTYTTYNLYTKTNSYSFTILENGIERVEGTITALPEEENGRIGIRIIGNSMETFLGNITIRRASSKDDFNIWEDVNTFTLKEGSYLDVLWYDCTVESGVWYKYGMQKRDSIGTRGVITIIKDPVMIMFEDMFLNAEGEQLKIKYNANVSSMKQVVMESKIDTIGSKYPFIKRNAYTNYKQFPISGLITHFTDDYKTFNLEEILSKDSLDRTINSVSSQEDLFASKEDIFKDSLEHYEHYNRLNNITEYNDYILEREFRNKVSDFLYKNNVKLFRSLTEGNILIKLMDINLTPEQGLGRYIYSFSATAYEIDECTLENYNTYGIQELGMYDSEIEYGSSILGQSIETIPANRNVLTTLNAKYQQLAAETYVIQSSFLDYLKLEFQDKPYLIQETSTGPVKYETAAAANEQQLLSLGSENKSLYLGYIARINDKTIIIPPEGIYTLDNPELQITSIEFPIDTNIVIDYNIRLEYVVDVNQLVKNRNYYQKVGQLRGLFTKNDHIYEEIWQRYYEQYSTYVQTVTSIDYINIEADPGTVVYIKEDLEDGYDRHIIGETCTLVLGDINSSIGDVYFTGVHFAEKTDNNNSIYPRYVETNLVVDSADEIKEPQQGEVYTINSERKIWYNNNWYVLDENNDISCPISAMVDYTCEIMKGVY